MTMVARRGEDGRLRWLSWKELPRLQWFKTLYKTKPALFCEENGVLYKKSVSGGTTERLRTLLNSCLKIAGTKYALALSLSDGDRQGHIFKTILETLNTRMYQDKAHWVDVFESYIKECGVAVALVRDGITRWEDAGFDAVICTTTLKTYLVTKPELFEKVDNTLFFLPTQNILLENMFFRCVEIAGGEHALAVALSADRLTKERHLKNFERMSFKHEKNYRTYATLFSDYLERHQTLFDEECLYA